MDAVNENTTDETFDFGFDNFRPMGFTYDGVVIQARIEAPKEKYFTFEDKRNGKTVTREAKPQLVVLIQPLDHQTKTGNPYPEYLSLTHNTRSKLGIFVEHLAKLGIKLGTEPEKLEGMAFHWEVKEVDFGGGNQTRIAVPIARLDALSESAAAPTAATASAAPADILAGVDVEGLVSALHGTAVDDIVVTVGRATKNPTLVAKAVDGTLARVLAERGMITEDNGNFVASAPAAA